MLLSSCQLAFARPPGAFTMIARPYNHQSLPATDMKILLLSGGFVNDLVITFRMAYLNERLFDVCSGANKCRIQSGSRRLRFGKRFS